MHAALTALQQEANADATPMPRPAPRERLRLGTPLVAALAVAATAAALAAAWPFFGSRSGPGELRAPLEARAASVPIADHPDAKPAVMPAALAVVDTAVAAPAPRMPEPIVGTAPTPAPPDVASPAVAPPTDVARIAIEVSSPSGARETTEPRTAPAPASGAATDVPQGDEAQTVALAVAALEQAMRTGDLEAGQAKLDDLAALLPARSLTLLRMQAWHAHQSGDSAQAIALYGEVVQRVPGDRNAAINLAVLEAGQGDVEGASQRLRALRSTAGDSEELSAAMALVGALPR